LASDKELSDFLKSVDKRAFKRALYAVRNEDAALDIVQDTMIRLSEKYADRPPAELPLLFQRILSNATMDWFRRQKVKNAVVRNFSEFETAGGDGDFEARSPQKAPRIRSHGRRSCLRSRPKLRGCRGVNEKPSCCVTGRNSMSPKPLQRWAVRRGVSRRTARARCMPCPQP